MTSDLASQANILVTGIGGNVGQGILRNIRRAYPRIQIVGTDIAKLNPGLHFCDKFYLVPYAVDPNYKALLLKICEEEKIDLIIPSTDYEAHVLSSFSEELPKLIASSAETTKIFLDKLLSYAHFKDLDLPFAPSCLPEDYKGQWREIILKPREGRGSRNIEINPKSLEKFDKSYMAQELIRGEEITSCIYVDSDKQILGPITMQRILCNGMTERCWVAKEHDEKLSKIWNKLVANLDIYGPCNMQAIVKDTGEIVPFEVNCRYSGTNSIRPHFGFDDVCWGIEEKLFAKKLAQPKIRGGTALRVFMDIIYQDQAAEEIEPGSNRSFIY